MTKLVEVDNSVFSEAWVVPSVGILCKIKATGVWKVHHARKDTHAQRKNKIATDNEVKMIHEKSSYPIYREGDKYILASRIHFLR